MKVKSGRVYFDVSDAASLLGVSKMTVYRYIHDDRLSSTKKYGRTTLDHNEVMKLKKEREA